MGEKFTDNNESGLHNHSLVVNFDGCLPSQCTLKIRGAGAVRDTDIGYDSSDKVLAVKV